MAILKAVRSRGKGDVLINVDHVLEFRPVSTTDRRTRVVLNVTDVEGKNKSFIIEKDFDSLDFV